MMKVKDVATRLRCSQANVYALIASGRLAHFRIGLSSGGIRVTDEQLEDFLNASRLGPTKAGWTGQHRLKHLRI